MNKILSCFYDICLPFLFIPQTSMFSVILWYHFLFLFFKWHVPSWCNWSCLSKYTFFFIIYEIPGLHGKIMTSNCLLHNSEFRVVFLLECHSKPNLSYYLIHSWRQNHAFLKGISAKMNSARISTLLYKNRCSKYFFY